MARSTVFLSGNNYEKVRDYGAALEETRELIMRYTQGECAVLAERVYQITGWPIITLSDGPTAIHWLNRREDGAYVDAHGAVPAFLKAIIEKRHEVKTPNWKSWTSHFDMTKGDIAEVDEFLSGPWMLAVIPIEDRLLVPLPIESDDSEAADVEEGE